MKNASGIGAVGALKVGDTVQFPPRPGHGTAGKLSKLQIKHHHTDFLVGRKIAVYANYLKVTAQAQLQLTRYNVEISPEAKGKKLARVFQLLREYGS